MAKDSQIVADRTRPGVPGRRESVSPQQWWRETRAELRKVTWPTFDQTRNLTVVVIAVCLVMAVFLGIVDFILSQIVSKIIGV